jgi:hypothetical protein
MSGMSSDDLMLSLVLAGIALTTVYFYVAYVLWRKHNTDVQKKAAALRELHLQRITQQHDAAANSPAIADASLQQPRDKGRLAA